MPAKARRTRRESKKLEEEKSKHDVPSETLDHGQGDFLFPKESSEDMEWGEEMDEYYGDSEFKIEPKLSRTSFLIMDYRRFKAARTIQTAWRGWWTRKFLERKRLSAIIIQSIWRGWYARRMFYKMLENRVQQVIEEHYYRSARMIQALWRGWWVRQNIHDHYRLKGVQINCAEDLMHCVAFKLHHLLRTRQIPGIYSLRNSHCLSKVEQLLAAMTFKHHNIKVRQAQMRRENKIHDSRKKFGETRFSTNVPFPGPNYEGICEPRCATLFGEADADTKMFKILTLYQDANNADARVSKARESADEKQNKIKKKSKHKKKKHSDFCGDVVKSMKRWKILHDNNVSVNPDVFKTPENVEHFLHEVQSILSLFRGRCHCNIQQNKLPTQCTTPPLM